MLAVFMPIGNGMVARFQQFQGFLEQSFANGTGLFWALWNPILVACAFCLSPLVALLHDWC